jgi:uncharacterized repeat protein (TIGR03803 family)
MKLKLVLPVLTIAAIMVPAAQGGSKFKVLHDFGARGDGTIPYGPLLLDKHGNLYGVTIDGGTGKCSDYGCGTLFELTPGDAGWGETILHDFVFSEGEGPVGPLGLDSAGNLYGTTSGGGPTDLGAVFQLTRDGSAFSLLYDLGAGPSVILDETGNIYGIMGPGAHKAGAISELSPGSDGWTYTALYSFCSENQCADGFDSVAPPSWDAKGNLYGTTYFGGYGYGVAFELSRTSTAAQPGIVWKFHVMHRFGKKSTDGRNPNGGLTVDSFGNAYGTTPVGGAGCASPGCGTVFKLTPVPHKPGRWTETILYDFPSVPPCSKGCAPAFDLVFDQAGNLYGLNGGGLSCGGAPCGMVYKLSPQKNGRWKYSIVHEFKGSDGAFPRGLTIDDKGNLFGVTTNGGTYNEGVAFEITP